MRSAPGQLEQGDPECLDPAAMLSKFLGPRYRELAKNWIPTASMWGAMGAVGLVWATDWRLILDWVPYINGKFKKDD
ncbi:cytochrome b-c1 complex subunit 10 [Microtus oregoni]|uniref:cytochrome b-c1 complex subunit 10 n=2 Tax=Microtus oregoni TaxID=111838 RepID=UPI001BB14F93|nr:cytochrome b-c1 complex subunit 10 [Microtus oregoni]XP_041524688.1 cytochrome b-c1 complex subunit 10 [Microtus oregoni]XP_041524689.1 cytochrome b-c1 complex subunit 10 [Microtus oregoni]